MARVLLMDEEITSQRWTMEALHSAGHHVRSVSCLGSDAVRGITRCLGQVDLLIADADLTEWSRANASGMDWRLLYPGWPTILLSNLRPLAENRLRDDQTFIQKPVGVGHLLHYIEKLTPKPSGLAA